MRKRQPVTKPARKPLPSQSERKPKPSPAGDFIDSREPGRQYAQDMIEYIDPATGERTSRTRGIIPAPGSRFIRLGEYERGIKSVGQRDVAQAQYDALMRQQMAQYQTQLQNYSQQQIPGAMTSGTTQRQLLGPESGFNAALNAANIQNQFQDYASGVNNLMSGQQSISPRQNAANINQAMQTYQNLIGQGMANMQAQNMTNQFGQPQQPKKNPSTPSFQSPRPFG